MSITRDFIVETYCIALNFEYRTPKANLEHHIKV